MASAVLDRRRFLQGMAGAAGLLPVLSPRLLARVRAGALRQSDRDPETTARDEDFWRPIQDAYPVDRSLINLNNGGVSPSPSPAVEALRRMQEFANQCPARNMWQIQEPQRESVREGLARLFGADAEEIAICRNASEALETVTFGLDLEPGDEVLSTSQDYPRMVASWKQRQAREGVVFRQISIPPPLSHTDIVKAFEAAITARTRVLHFCHVINLTGQILPVRELCELARSRGILSLVDGAHAFAHVTFSASDFRPDFYGTSLHKWLSAPIGTGMLFVRRELIPRVWPLFGADAELAEDIRKFEQIGTHPCPLFLSIGEAIRFHDAIGPARKEARLRYLRDSWARRVQDLPGVRLHTSLERAQSCGIATVEIQGVDPADLAQHLWNRHRIFVTPIVHEEFQGIRVTPHVYTTPQEIEAFVAAFSSVARDGLPG